MTALSWIADTIWEFWQYMKPNGNVYLAGVQHKEAYLFVRMIPEHVALPEGYVKLSDVMTREKASQRWNHFKLIEIVEPKKSSEIGT